MHLYHEWPVLDHQLIYEETPQTRLVHLKWCAYVDHQEAMNCNSHHPIWPIYYQETTECKT